MILCALIMVGTGTVYAFWKWGNKLKTEQNTVFVESYSKLTVHTESGNGNDYDIAVHFTVNGFGAPAEGTVLLIEKISFSCDESSLEDWNDYLPEIWQYRVSESGDWKELSSEDFILEKNPQCGETYTLYLSKQTVSGNEAYEDGALKLTGTLKEYGYKTMTATAKQSFAEGEELVVQFFVEDHGTVVGVWELVVSEMNVTESGAEGIWQYRIGDSVEWNHLEANTVLLADAQSGTYIVYLRKDPQINELNEDVVMQFTVTVREAT